MSSPAKFSLSYLLIDVYLTGHFPQLFIIYNPGPLDLKEENKKIKGMMVEQGARRNKMIRIRKK
jgi:hypothetical protein